MEVWRSDGKIYPIRDICSYCSRVNLSIPWTTSSNLWELITYWLFIAQTVYIYIYLLYRIKTIIRSLINFNKFEKNHLERTILEANWNQHISYELKFHKISYTLITFEAKNSPSQLYPPLNFRKRMQIGAVSIHLPFRRITIRQSPRWILIKCPPPSPIW